MSNNIVDTSKNNVHIEGIVKRDETSNMVRKGLEILNFCLMVPSTDNDVYVDCFCTTEACEMLEGKVYEGEALSVDGFLTYRTYSTASGLKRSGVVVYVTDVCEI